MNLPSLSTLDDNAVRVLCAEAHGWAPVKPWEKCLEELRYSYPSHLPNFPADANAALSLADALAKDGWRERHDRSGSLWFVQFSKGGANMHSATGPTLARAIANAFLLVRNLATP